MPKDTETTTFRGSWLCPTPVDRARMLDLDARLDSSWTLIEQVFPLTAIVAAWRVGPWALLPLVCVPIFAVLPKLIRQVRQPEWLMMGALLTFIATITTAVAFTGGVHSPLSFWVIFYFVGCAARFGRRALAFATIAGVAATIAAALATSSTRTWHDLPALLGLLAVAVVSGRYTRVLTRAEFDHREAALIDELTGLLNRKALEARFEQERQQAVHGDGTICIILCDVDGFKEVNDRHGHDCGDAVLRETASALGEALRTSELIFRIGGDEFLFVLPGVSCADGAAVARRLRAVVAARRPGGLSLTASFGVAAAQGTEIAFETLFHRADTALYAAKSAGRNRVSVAHPKPPAALAA